MKLFYALTKISSILEFYGLLEFGILDILILYNFLDVGNRHL